MMGIDVWHGERIVMKFSVAEGIKMLKFIVDYLYYLAVAFYHV